MDAGDHFRNGASPKSLMSREVFKKKCLLNLKAIRLICLFLVVAIKLHAQGSNNNFDYDRDDFNMIFKELGISTFKFPVKQDSSQLLNIVLEEYEDKKLLNTISIIDDAKSIFGKIGYNAITFFEVEKDSIYFHRFYFVKKDSILRIRIKTHGFEVYKDFSLSGKSAFSFNALADFKSEDGRKYLEIDKSEIIMFMYANSSEEKDKPLFCPNGLTKEQLLERFHYFIFVSVEPYNKE
jgi:hypothetical protein